MFSFNGLLFKNKEYEDLIISEKITMEEKKPMLRWKGGKIELKEWQKILTFFRKNSKEEAQCRLYYNTSTKEWNAWAMPQIKNGMTTQEIAESKEKTEQLKNFPDPWLYFGTVHHHCSSSAFQSGTDSKSEAEQDGLHITVGHINDEFVDLHVRFTHKTINYGITNLKDFFTSEENQLNQYIQLILKDNTVDRDYPSQWDLNVHGKPKIIQPKRTNFYHQQQYFFNDPLKEEEETLQEMLYDIDFLTYIAGYEKITLQEYLILVQEIEAEPEDEQLIKNAILTHYEDYIQQKGEFYENFSN